MTDGEREIDGRQFYLRLSQRIAAPSAPAAIPSGIIGTKWTRGCVHPARRMLADYQPTLSPITSATEAPTWSIRALVRLVVRIRRPAVDLSV